MRIVGKIVKWLAILIVVAVAGAAVWLHVAPPALLRGAMAYAAKNVCSYHFIAGRDAGEVLASDIHEPAAHPILRYIGTDADEERRFVTARLLGFLGNVRAAYRDGYGCVTLAGGGEPAALPALAAIPAGDPALPWPQGEGAGREDPAIAAILDDPALVGQGMRGAVVVHDGRIVGERYAEGYGPQTPLLGWSMTKTVTAALVGIRIGEERLSLDQDGLFEEWTGDERSTITIEQLMAMSSGLEFNEDYGGLTDVTRMLYLEPDMAAFAADKPLAAEPGTHFSYSSGTTALLSALWRESFDDPQEAALFPHRALFGPLGMSSAVLEADMIGTYAGSSSLYASARDWARFGELMRNDGVWQGARILPEGFAAWMREPAPAADGLYGRGQLWLRGPGGDAGAGLPADTFWIRGHDGQSVTVIPSRRLVVVRMGLTPSRVGYRPQRLVEAITAALD